jgi:hypothetical protein
MYNSNYAYQGCYERFYIDESPAEIAKSLVDKHIVKMPVESTQMLSTAKWKHGIMSAWFPHYMSSSWDAESCAEKASFILEVQQKKTLPMDDRVFNYGRKICYAQATSMVAA